MRDRSNVLLRLQRSGDKISRCNFSYHLYNRLRQLFNFHCSSMGFRRIISGNTIFFCAAFPLQFETSFSCGDTSMQRQRLNRLLNTFYVLFSCELYRLKFTKNLLDILLIINLKKSKIKWEWLHDNNVIFFVIKSSKQKQTALNISQQ